jgi:hypothetical protein
LAEAEQVVRTAAAALPECAAAVEARRRLVTAVAEAERLSGVLKGGDALDLLADGALAARARERADAEAQQELLAGLLPTATAAWERSRTVLNMAISGLASTEQLRVIAEADEARRRLAESVNGTVRPDGLPALVTAELARGGSAALLALANRLVAELAPPLPSKPGSGLIPPPWQQPGGTAVRDEHGQHVGPMILSG